MRHNDDASISAMCSPSGYSIYLSTIVLYRGSVKHLLPEQPGQTGGQPDAPTARMNGRDNTKQLENPLEYSILYSMMLGSKGLSPHELAHKWVKDLRTRPDMSIKVG